MFALLIKVNTFYYTFSSIRMIKFVKLTKKLKIMHVIGLVLFAMALGLGALFLLAKAQKENLGKLFSVSAYVVLTVSVLVILFSITAGIMHCCHSKGGCGKHKMENGSGCPMMKGGCDSNSSCGESKGSCSKGESCEKGGKSCSKGGSSCHMGAMKGGDCMMNPHGGKSFEKRIIKKGDTMDVQVEVITE